MLRLGPVWHTHSSSSGSRRTTADRPACKLGSWIELCSLRYRLACLCLSLRDAIRDSEQSLQAGCLCYSFALSRDCPKDEQDEEKLLWAANPQRGHWSVPELKFSLCRVNVGRKHGNEEGRP